MTKWGVGVEGGGQENQKIDDVFYERPQWFLEAVCWYILASLLKKFAFRFYKIL